MLHLPTSLDGPVGPRPPLSSTLRLPAAPNRPILGQGAPSPSFPPVLRHLALAVAALVLTTLPAGAAISPFRSEVRPADDLDGLFLALDRPGRLPASVQTVVVRDEAGSPLAGVVVRVSFDAPGLAFCEPGFDYTAITDAEGRAEIALAGIGGCADDVTGAATISADGVVLRSFRNVKGPDFDGVGGTLAVDLRDFVIFSGEMFGTESTACHDYDNNGVTNLADLALGFSQALVEAHECAPLSNHQLVPAQFPSDPAAWTFRPGLGYPPLPHQTLNVIYDEGTERWHAMGAFWEDEAEQHLATSPNGLDSWVPSPIDPVIEYDESRPPRDDDWYVQTPNYGRNPDGTLKKLDGRWIVVVCNFDGKDSDLQWLTSEDGFVWDERGDTGVEIGPEGSEDRGEQWPSTLLYNPGDATWYLFYHGGGAWDQGSGRTIGVATGPSPKELTPRDGFFEDDGLITQFPFVLADAEGWIMVYQHGSEQRDGIWYARSTDLLHWTPQGQILESTTGKLWLDAWTVVYEGDTVTWRIYARISGVKGVYEATVPRLRP